MINDKWFYDNMRKNQKAIDKFWKERPKGMKLCPNCWVIFDTPGFPSEGSWSCTEWCFDAANYRNPIIPQDTISRLYLIDIPDMSWAHELTLIDTEKKIHKLLKEREDYNYQKEYQNNPNEEKQDEETY